MLKKTAPFLVASASLAFIAMSGCRTPVFQEDWTPPSNIEEFDAAVDDDAGPGKFCPEGSPDLFNNAYSPYIGGEETIDMAVVDFSYFRCPHCAHCADMIRKIWTTNPTFKKHVRLYFHHFPFSNETAWKLHAATAAAGYQGVEYFWAMHDYIYDGMALDSPKYYSVEDLAEYAENILQLDMDQWEFDRNQETNPDTYSYLQWDKAQAHAVGITGTPSLFVCGKKINWSKLETVVESYLNND